MRHIKREGYDGVYKLDEIPLTTQKIQITWPDKTTTKHVIKIKKIEERYNDMGHACSMTLDMPMITINHHGHHIEMNLGKLDGFRGVKIEVVE